VNIRGAKATALTTVTVTGNQFKDYAGASTLDAALRVTNAATITIDTNSFLSVPASGTAANGHAVQVWGVLSFAFNMKKNIITGSAGGIHLVTGVTTDAGNDFSGLTFKIPSGKVQLNHIDNTHFGIAVCDLAGTPNVGPMTNTGAGTFMTKSTTSG
jgi:hypothetical protein